MGYSDLETTENGNLVNYADWTEDIAREIAAGDGIAELTENASLQLYMSELSDAQNDKSGVTDATAQQGYLRNLLVAVADRNGFAPPAPQQETNSNVERAGIAGMALLDSDGKPIVLTPEMPPLSGKQRAAMAWPRARTRARSAVGSPIKKSSS